MAFGLFIVRLFLGVPFIIWGIGKLRGGDARIAPLIAGSEHRGNATEVLKNIIVAGGYGMGSAENFKLLYDLADTLGGCPVLNREEARS